ncbi:NADPH oxidase activator 1 [Spea bombifrons]|uniref:NADPH oxidase activator 1 n=1 Tax=Spea bombifrons TaxID=233779 RepID=UPI00234A1817|nr:NADPH oxidase activator 1 [Spea bombifrons]
MPDRGPQVRIADKMPYRDLIQHWHEGVLAADQKDYDLALEKFRSIGDPPAKIWFNIGSLHLLKGELQQSLEAFDTSLGKDRCLAVGFSQRSYVHFQLQKYEKALSDCHQASAHLRNNSLIDYKQLGLKYVLHTWEVLYNTAAALCQLGRWESAEEKLREAVKWVPGEAKTPKLEAALESVQSRTFLIPTHVPEGELFRPKKQEVEQLNSRDFLGKPKVIVSVVPNDQYSGFEPLRPQNRGFYEPGPDAVLGQEAGYHRVLIHYYPEDSNDVAVKANSHVYVLNKDGEWAAAVHNGQKILIPTSILKPANAPKSDIKQDDNGIPMPPMKIPPSRPAMPSPQQMLWLNNDDQDPLLKQIPPRPEGKPPAPSKMKNSSPGESVEELRTPVIPEPSRRENAVPLTNPVLQRDVPLTRAPMLEKALPLGRTPLMEINPATERPSPPTDKVAERSPPTTTDLSILEARKAEPDPPRGEAAPPPAEDNEITLRVHTEFTVSMKVQKDITYPELQDLLRRKLRQHGEQMNIQLSYRDSEGKALTLVKGDEDLQGMLKQTTSKHLMFCCKDAYHCVGRPVLYRMRALYQFPAERPGDLSFNPGDIIDILSEVNDEWLEGHCAGSIGIFPNCFVSRFEES